MRRLPVYLLLDCSESMIGDSIRAVEEGVGMLISQLRSDPHALETAYVSVITYHGKAEVAVPLTELTTLQLPRLEARPGSNLGPALRLLSDCIRRDVVKTTPDRKGDYRPIVFLLTDGQPTDDWQSVKDAIDRVTRPRVANFYAIGCGEDIDFDVLHQVADVVFRMQEMTPKTLQKLFLWLTASVQSASTGAGAGDNRGGLDISKKPAEVDEVAPGSIPRYSGPPRQVFVKLMCSQVRRPYLVRYRWDEIERGYDPIGAHPLESRTDEAADFTLPPLTSSALMGTFPCPFCGNPAAAVCSCGAVFCIPPFSGDRGIRCPKCLKMGMYGGSAGGADFDIGQSAG